MKKIVITPNQMRVLEEAFTNTPETFEGENHHAPDLVDFQGRTYYWRNDDALPFFVLSDRTIEYGEKGERHDKHINDTYGDGFPARNFVDDIILQGRYWPSGNMFSFWDVDWDYFSAQQLITLMSKVCGDQGKNVEGAKLAYRDKVYGVAEGRFIELENTKERRTLDDAMYRSLDTMFKSELDYVKRTVYVMERVGQGMACRQLNDLEAYAAACYRFSSDFFHNKNSQYDKEDFREYIDRKFKGRTSFDELYSYFTRVLRNKTVPSAQRNSYFHTMSNFKDDIMDCAYENGLADVDIRVLPDESGKPYSYNVKTMKASAAKKFYNAAIKRGFIVDRFMERPLNNWNGEPFDIITFRVRYPALLKEDTAIDNGYYGGVNCTLNFDEDYYEEYLQDNGLQDLPAVKTEYVKDNCDWDVEYLDGETWHACDFKTLNYSEMEDDFGETLAAAILNDCMDEREHSFEFSEYRDDDVDIYNPQSLNKAAKRVMATMDSPCGQSRGWILTDGTVLDAGWDHNACFRISPEIKYREDFTKLGNVRFSNVSLEFGKYPTHEQLQQVRQFCEYHNQDVIYVDFLGGKNGRADKKYVGLDFSELSADLYDYYSGRSIRSTLQEATDIDELQLYHGTNHDFNEFNEEFFLTGIGEMAFGWGVYLTNSKETAKAYGPGGQIMTVEVPDGKYLHSEKIRKDEAMSLARAFYKFYLSGKGGEIYKGSERDFWDYECRYIGESPDGSYLYGTISTFLGSDREASEWLRTMGYVGMKIPGHNANTGEEFLNYLIFSTKDVKIIKKEAVTDTLNESAEVPVADNDVTMRAIERKNGIELSEKGKKWFRGLMDGAIFGITMDIILEKVVFQFLNITPFPVGQSVGNEWDELDGVLRVVIKKTGVGEDILQRVRSLKAGDDRNIISGREWDVLNNKLGQYPSILEELKRCYYNFAVVAPVIYKAVDYLKNYKGGKPALEFCYLVGYQREQTGASLNDAVTDVLWSSKGNLLPRLTAGGLNK